MKYYWFFYYRLPVVEKPLTTHSLYLGQYRCQGLSHVRHFKMFLQLEQETALMHKQPSKMPLGNGWVSSSVCRGRSCGISYKA